MRIAFTGASGTGKTTLAEWIQEEYSLEYNPIGARSVAKAMGYDCVYDVDIAGNRYEFQRSLLKGKVEWEAKHDSFVTDRTTYDNLLYAVLHDIYGIELDDHLDIADKALRRYDLIIYCPLRAFHDTKGDAQRVADFAYHKIYDACLGGLYLQSGVPYVTLKESDLKDRKDRLKFILSDLKVSEGDWI